MGTEEDGGQDSTSSNGETTGTPRPAPMTALQARRMERGTTATRTAMATATATARRPLHLRDDRRRRWRRRRRRRRRPPSASGGRPLLTGDGDGDGDGDPSTSGDGDGDGDGDPSTSGGRPETATRRDGISTSGGTTGDGDGDGDGDKEDDNVDVNQDGIVIVGYFAQWGIYARDYDIWDIPEEIDVVQYAFWDVNPDGTLRSPDPYADFDHDCSITLDPLCRGTLPWTGTPLPYCSNFRAVNMLQQTRGTKVVLSLGG